MLTFLVLFPLIAALLCYLMSQSTARYFSVAVCLVELVGVCIAAKQGAASFTYPWFPSLGINYSLKLTGLGVLMLGLTPLLCGAASIMQPTSQRSQALFSGHLLLMMTALQGVFLADNLGLFYVFFELMLLPTLLLVSFWGNDLSYRSAVKFLLYTLAGSLPMLLGIIQLSVLSPQPDLSFSALANLDASVQLGLFGLFFIAFAVKVPLFPFHGWQVELYENTPPAAAALVAGAMSKAGLYGFAKICVQLLPDASRVAAPSVIALASFSLVYGCVCALGSKRIRTLLAYSSLSHLGLIVIGLFVNNAPGRDGALLQMFSHGLCTGGLFLIVAALHRRNVQEDFSEIGGLHQKLPQLSTLALFFTIAALGCPGLSAFPGELTLFTGFYAVNPTLAAVLSLTVVGSAWYMLRFYQTVFQGQLKGCPEGTQDLTASESWALYPLAILIVFTGMAPQLLLLWTRILPWN